MTWKQEALSVLKSFKDEHQQRLPQMLILPLAREDDVSYGEFGDEEWSKITVQGASNVIRRLFGVQVEWVDVPHVEARG
jgi:hypothetical protein